MSVTLKVRNNGSILVDGDVTLLDGDGNPIPTTPGKPFSLCRCGASARKPFCDGSHKRVGFTDACEAVRTPVEAAAPAPTAAPGTTPTAN